MHNDFSIMMLGISLQKNIRDIAKSTTTYPTSSFPSTVKSLQIFPAFTLPAAPNTQPPSCCVVSWCLVAASSALRHPRVVMPPPSQRTKGWKHWKNPEQAFGNTKKPRQKHAKNLKHLNLKGQGGEHSNDSKLQVLGRLLGSFIMDLVRFLQQFDLSLWFNGLAMFGLFLNSMISSWWSFSEGNCSKLPLFLVPKNATVSCLVFSCSLLWVCSLLNFVEHPKPISFARGVFFHFTWRGVLGWDTQARWAVENSTAGGNGGHFATN